LSDAGILSSVIVAVVAVFYLMFLRPVQKDQDRHRQEIRDLRPGDEVLTTSGFIGRVKVIFTALTSAILQRLTPAEHMADTNLPPIETSKPEQRGVSST
jgi:preprotein translocase YajC subunit